MPTLEKTVAASTTSVCCVSWKNHWISIKSARSSPLPCSLAHVHFLGFDLSHLGRPDPNRVFLPTDEPRGEIEAMITR